MTNTSTLFHYTSLDALLGKDEQQGIIKDQALKSNNLSRLNDAFDWVKTDQPIFVDVSTEENKNKFINLQIKLSQARNKIRNRHERRAAKKKMIGSDFKNDVKREIEERINNDGFCKIYECPKNEHISFISFSKVNPQDYRESALLWAHYANRMYGGVLEFSHKGKLNNLLWCETNYCETTPNVLSVSQYEQCFKSFITSGEMDPKEEQNIMNFIYRRKYIAYKYESEIRYITYRNFNLTFNAISDNPILTTIHLGANVSPNDTNRIKELCANTCDNNIKIHHYKKHPYKYTLI